MTPRHRAWVLVTALALTGCPESATVDPEAQDSSEVAPELTEVEPGTVRLFFPGGGRRLVSEIRPMPSELPGELPEVADVVAAVLAGPESSGGVAPFPEGTTAGTTQISKDGIAYVDLVSNRPDPPPSGSLAETLSVYSIVNSVLVNRPDLEAVVLLWNGQQQSTFAGHLDTGRPLSRDDSLIGG